MSIVPKMRRIDEACDRFEREWLQGRRPRLEAFLRHTHPDERGDFFRALLEVELELRHGERQTPRCREYVRRFPDFTRTIVEVMGEDCAGASDDVAESKPDRPDEGPPEQLVMEVIAGPHAGKSFTFDKHDLFLVGRSARAHLQLAGDRHFSRFHFRLEINPPECYLIDLGSRNGTFVNGTPVKECYLKNGDIISGGMTRLKLISNSADQTVALAPERMGDVLLAAEAAPAAGPPEADCPAAAPRNATAPKSPQAAAPRTPVLSAEPAFRQPPRVGKPSSGFPQLPGYQIEEELGRGELGVVYRAVQLSLSRPCAIKVMAPAPSASDKTLQIFIRECGILSQLNHEHIVRLLDQGTVGSLLFLATEYVPTIRLDQALKKRSLAERVRVCTGLMQQVLSALNYAHTRSLVHRDIKPGNILIARDGKNLTAKLADFGVAKQYTNSGLSQITRAGDVVGSLPYMPPEQFLNSRAARPQCDLYAAGATLYQWLSGQTPHDFPSGRNQFLVILEDPIVPITRRLPDVPPAIAAFLDRALARDPDQRFSSASEMRHALKEASSK